VSAVRDGVDTVVEVFAVVQGVIFVQVFLDLVHRDVQSLGLEGGSSV